MKKTLQWLYPLQRLDTRLFLWLNRIMADRRSLHYLALSVSHSGSGIPYAIAGLLCLWLEPEHGSYFAAMLACGYAIERPLYWMLKNSIRRRRPGEAIDGWTMRIIPSDRFSFPSGHTSGAFLFAYAISVYYPALYPWVLLWAMAVGSSRVLLGVHFPGDIMAGSLMGTLCAWLAALWVQ
ncbi:MAG: phosphatase PAP2 family protein [Gammaproteobacteria bacterium]|nr:MAG: phosphatase PAP2 family protein [Gammaproteobacteria bacterium]